LGDPAAAPGKESLTTALKMIAEPAVEVLTQPERRRRWSVEQKLAIVAETMRPGASATQVSRRYGISTGLLYTWRRLARGGALTMPPTPVPAAEFVPVRLATSPGDAPAAAGAREAPGSRGEGLMVIELAGGCRIRVGRDVDAEALRQVIAVVESAR
jgi:transposase